MPKKNLNFVPPTIRGPSTITVGAARWGVPRGSKIVHKGQANVHIAHVLTPEGTIHTLRDNVGQMVEAQFPEDHLRHELAAKYFPGSQLAV